MNASTPSVQTVPLHLPDVTLRVEWGMPAEARGVVIFVRGGDSSESSLHRRMIAGALHTAAVGTLLVDLLSQAENSNDLTHVAQLDAPLLTRRLLGVVDWLRLQPSPIDLPIGIFGTGVGAAAALRAAAMRPGLIHALVSQGGRLDLAEACFPSVTCPTLLLVGGWDDVVLQLNRSALPRLGGERRITIIPRATHRFEEPGALDAVARHTAQWFAHWLPSGEAAALCLSSAPASTTFSNLTQEEQR